MKSEDNLPKKEDRRIRKTKKMLRDSLFALLEKKNINNITVTELTKLADINRSTFYLYYKDVLDMMNKIQNEIYEVFYDTVVSAYDAGNDIDKTVGYIKNFLDFCKDNVDVCKFITRNDCNNKIFERILNSVQSIVPNSEDIFDSENDPRYYLTTFALNGMLHVIIKWMGDGMKIPSEDMARFLCYTYYLGAKTQKDSEISKLYVHPKR